MSTTAPPPAPSALRAWLAMAAFAARRQWRLGLPVWISLNLLALALLWVVLVSVRFQWALGNRPATFKPPVYTYGQFADAMTVGAMGRPWVAGGGELMAAARAYAAVLETSALPNFSDKIVFTLYLGFLMPLWTLCFATGALGSERESRSLIRLVTRPLPRWGVYLALYAGLLPWCLAMNLGGLALLCLAAGQPGLEALNLYWPGAVTGTLALAALFHLLAAVARRPAVVGLAYVFFYEPVVSSMPGFVKRFSVSFYMRCQMFDAAEAAGFEPVSRLIYSAVSGETALWVLGGLTAGLLVAGAGWFGRTEDRGDP
jgi:ABC-2 type transport system permease protein